MTRHREVDKNLVEASISKDPAAGTLGQELDCTQKAYREMSADTELELKVDTRSYNMIGVVQHM